ncbi:MAG: hypothetical protein DWH91_00870 [Planctomycetota bacterium]|nr:MAG: hypothetical protein DWH91_00870 [Planctomycetota bacterium]
MSPSILYCGDTSLATAASYLGGVITASGWSFDYVASDQELFVDRIGNRRLIILSDYPSARLLSGTADAIVASVQAGCGLLMIGGWESYHGLGGDWDRSPVARCLPVEIAAADDRRNCDHVILARPGSLASDHPILQGLPWESSPPVIGGYNQFEARANSQTLLWADHYAPRAEIPGEAAAFPRMEQTPLLVVSEFGLGRVAALATDLAPHWVGPLVDWGASQNRPRVTARAPGAEAVEVGSYYARFVQQLLAWTSRL